MGCLCDLFQPPGTRTPRSWNCRCSAKLPKGCPPPLSKGLPTAMDAFQATLTTIIVLDGLAFITFCTAVYLRKTCTPRRQKDVRTALRIIYGFMVLLGVIVVATNNASPAAAAIAGVLLGNAVALMVADFLVPRCFTLDTHSIGADATQTNEIRDVEGVT